MKQNSYAYPQSKNISYYNSNNSRNQFKSNNTVINLVNIIYDNEFVSLINELSSSLRDCFKLLNKLLNNVKEISTTLNNQTLYCKCLLKDFIMLNKKIKNEKLLQIMDRLDIIDNNRNLMDNNISFMNVNITSFLVHAKDLFKKMKVARNDKLNNIQNLNKINSVSCSKHTNNNLYKSNFNFNNYNNNSKHCSLSKLIKNKRNYSSFDNMRYKEKNINTLQNYNSLSHKKNKSFKNISENLLINSSDDINNNVYLDKGRDLSERQKTISFNLRRFMFNNNKINNLLDNSSLKKENKINNSNNLLFNYCSLVNNPKAKNNRKKVNNGNVQSLKNINSFKNDSRFNNFLNNNLYEIRNNESNINNKKRINFNYNSIDKINKIIKKDLDNSDSLKIIENKNNVNSILATKIIEYFTLIKNQEKNQIKIEKTKNYLMNISLNIINQNGLNKNISKERHITSLKHNFIKNEKLLGKDINSNSNSINKKNIMRNINSSYGIRVNDSVNKSNKIEKKENNNNIIEMLNKELNKKNEYIKRIKYILENRYKFGIIKAQNFEIIQKRKLLISIKKEINITYIRDSKNDKIIEELKNEIKELKKINTNDNNKNYKYKYELIQEEMNTKNNEIKNLNNKLDELTKNNNSLMNKLDTINIAKNNLEQEKTNLIIKIKKMEEINQDKKIIITNTDEEPIENFSDIIESSENEREKNLAEENNKLQEKINKLQSELNDKILNENDKNKKLSRNALNNEYENCIEFDPKDKIKKGKNDTNNNYNELKLKEDLIEKLQNKIKEYEKNKNIIYNKKDGYIILSEKNYKTLKWFLITKKELINSINYENIFWVDKEHVNEELIKTSNSDISDDEKIMLNYLRKLEEKENEISKLNLKIKNLEKNMNMMNINSYFGNPGNKSLGIKYLDNNDKISEENENFDFD